MADPRTLLFVDDYDMLRKIYREILTDAGYRVFEAASAAECMKSLSTDIPDLILLDIMMKPVDGWETLRMIRANPTTADLPVVMVSGKAVLPSEVTAYGPLIDGFLRKPLQNAVLISSIKDFFIWFDELKNQCEGARKGGADESAVSSYFTLRRQEKSMRLMLALIKREYESGGDMMANEIISDAIHKIEEFIEDICQKRLIVEKEISRAVS
jgi:CheY-like chemotaxis protein